MHASREDSESLLLESKPLDDNEDIETELGHFQTITSNVLMMGTLVFGFCATGTFLSVSFTGEESWNHVNEFVDFLRYGCYSAICSLTASMIAFIFSTRVANQRMQFGGKAALRIAHQSTIFIVAAELCLYFSFHEFMKSIKVYTGLEYTGPAICPQGDGQPNDRKDLFLNTSFCAQLGDDLYQGASSMCGAAVVLDAWGHTDEDYAERGNHRVGEYFVTCTAFDYYTTTGWDTFWFAWDWKESGYGVMELKHEMTPRESFFRVLAEVGDYVCGRPGAEIARDVLCTGTNSSTAACAQARTAFLLADKCSGGVQDDGIRCRKVCAWVTNPDYDEDDETSRPVKPLKQVIHMELDFWMSAIVGLIRIIMVIRFIAGIFRTWVNFKKLCLEQGHAMVLIGDVGGLFDIWGNGSSSDGVFPNVLGKSQKHDLSDDDLMS